MNEVKCPRCGSNQISANKKGFSAGKAVAGAVVAGPIGAAAGAIGKDKVMITCLSCGEEWQAGKDKERALQIAGEKTPLTKSGKWGLLFLAAVLLFFIYKISQRF